MSFPDWIRAVVERRPDKLTIRMVLLEQKVVRLIKAYKRVCKTVFARWAQIATVTGLPTGIMPHRDMTVFQELLGLSEQRIEPLLADAVGHLDVVRQIPLGESA